MLKKIIIGIIAGFIVIGVIGYFLVRYTLQTVIDIIFSIFI